MPSKQQGWGSKVLGHGFQHQEVFASKQSGGRRGTETRTARRKQAPPSDYMRGLRKPSRSPTLSPQAAQAESRPLPLAEKSMVLSSSSLSRSKRSLNSTLSSFLLSPTFRRFISGKFKSSSWKDPKPDQVRVARWPWESPPGLTPNLRLSPGPHALPQGLALSHSWVTSRILQQEL